MDETPATNGDKYYALGVVNEQCRNHALALFRFEDYADGTTLKSAKVVDVMISQLRGIFGDGLASFVVKVTSISSDSCSEQKSINKFITEQFQNIATTARPIIVTPCAMHACSNAETKMILAQPKCVQEFLTSIHRLAGKGTVNNESIAGLWKSVCDENGLDHPFYHKKGKRWTMDSLNARSGFLAWNDLVVLLDECKASKKAQSLLDVIVDNVEELRTGLGRVALGWTIIRDFWSRAAKPQTRLAFACLLRSIQVLQSQALDPTQCIDGVIRTRLQSARDKWLLGEYTTQVASLRHEAQLKAKDDLRETVVVATTKILDMMAVTEPIIDPIEPIASEMIVPTNIPPERLFSRFKLLEERFKSMSKYVVAEMAKSCFNRMPSFMNDSPGLMSSALKTRTSFRDDGRLEEKVQSQLRVEAERIRHDKVS